jgi:ABC-type multidrug transport system ATPase subunit/pSer/pThr/pTyr-binding forkhead associated (FHA) protein
VSEREISYVLQIWIGQGSVNEHPVLKTELSLGRGDANDVVLDDPQASNRHARLTFQANTPQVMDLGSSNGTLLNGRPLSAGVSIPFHPGDVITISAFNLTVRLVSPQSPAPAAVAERVRLSARPQAGLALYVQRRLVQKYPLDKPSCDIGRTTDNDLTVNHPQVSKRHARLQLTPAGYQITDQGSTNGLTYDGQRISSKTLQDGDLVYLNAEVALQFCAHLGLVPAVSQVPPLATQQINLDGQETFNLGRSSQNDIVLDHPQVSRHHAMLERLGGRYRLRDLKSSNGIFVNGDKVDKDAWLKQGDEIRIGPFRLILAGDGIQQVSERGLRLDVFNLQKWVRKDLNLLQDISLSIYPREFVALVGLSGAGKSTLMDAINGFRPATQGTVIVNGDDLYKNFDLYRNDMGYVPQQDIVHRELTTYAALNYAARLRMPADTSPQERHQRVTKVIQDLDLAERQDVPIHKLSGGQLKRVSIGVELLTKPRLFFLDEPTSGLDPGTEYNMMRMLRRLADQGRTIVLITHDTKNVMMCDKVIILVRGGHLAYYGPPEEALTYFDQYRTAHERRIKNIEFDDIYTILEDEARGGPAEWDARYRQSRQYQENVALRLQDTRPPSPAAPGRGRHSVQAARQGASAKRVSALRQLAILSSRNLKIMRQDKIGLLMMLLLAPLLGLEDFIWGHDLFEPAKGDATKVITMLFMMSLTTILVGALSSVREIVKETDIYKRERAINLKIAPYILSKVWVGVLLALYQALVFLIFKLIFVMRPGSLPAGDAAYLLIYATLFLGTLTGYLMGLAISAAAPNQNIALILVIAVLVPQFLFAGALLPLDLIPGGKAISQVATTRWAFEALVNISGVGQPLADDDCWDSRPKDGPDGWNTLLNKSNAEKQSLNCACMGPAMFETCLDFPGVQNEDFYTQQARADLNRPAPAKPLKPTPYPTLTPLPTPATPQDMGPYMEDSQEQGQEYADLREEQGDAYENAVTQWGEDKGDWEENRQKSISGAEGLLKGVFESYGHAFQGAYVSRWAWMSGIIVVLLAAVILFQRAKDTI